MRRIKTSYVFCQKKKTSYVSLVKPNFLFGQTFRLEIDLRPGRTQWYRCLIKTN